LASRTAVFTYDLDETATTTIDISEDGGATWDISTDSISGAVGNGITAGVNKSVNWNGGGLQ
jgi:hypothetical protein